VEILTAYARARRESRRQDLRATVAVLRARDRSPLAPASDGFEEGLRLARATVRALAALPLDSRCLMCSLILTQLLDRRGIGSRLVIGIRPGERFGAHAWVEVDSRTVPAPGAGSFERLTEV